MSNAFVCIFVQFITQRFLTALQVGSPGLSSRAYEAVQDGPPARPGSTGSGAAQRLPRRVAAAVQSLDGRFQFLWGIYKWVQHPHVVLAGMWGICKWMLHKYVCMWVFGGLGSFNGAVVQQCSHRWVHF